MKLQQLTLWQGLRSKQILLLTGIALCAALAGWYLGNIALLQQQQLLSSEVTALQQQLLQKEQALAAQIKQSDYLTAELAVERNTIALQQQDLKAEQQKLFDTRKELAFYQKIISPDLQANSLIIESFSLTKGSAVGSYKFNLVLIEQDKQKNFAKGQISLTLQGKKQGKKTNIDLLKLAGFAKADRRFSFKHFQIFEGEFVLPAAFEAEQVEVTISVPASRGLKAAKVSKTLLWDEALPGEILE
jgi:multidrug efflux pump subunit AcrA (membrane-fusion protein)